MGLRNDIRTAQVDADDVEQLVRLFNDFKPELVMNLALPYQDLTIMEACLQTGCHYLDTANYEPRMKPISNTPGSGLSRTLRTSRTLRHPRLRI